LLLSLPGSIRLANATSAASVYQEAAALGQSPYLSEKPFCFAALVALRPQIRKHYTLPGKTHYRPRMALIKEYLRTILASRWG